MDRAKVIKWLEETEIMLRQAVDRGGDMAVIGAFKCYNHVSNALAMLKEQQAEIEQLKAQKQKWLQTIADQQLAVSPTGYETEEELAKRTGEWNGLQMAWEILTEGR